MVRRVVLMKSYLY